MTTKRELWRTELARKYQLPPEEYDMWTLWGDRGWGKTRAVIEEILRLAEMPVMTQRGQHVPTIGVFVENIREGFDQLVFGPKGMAALSDMGVEVSAPGARMNFDNGAVVKFWPFRNAHHAEGAQVDHFIIEDAERARIGELETIYRVWRYASRWNNARLIQTCHILPPFGPRHFIGPRRHLSIGPAGEENTALSKGYVDQLVAEAGYGR